MPFLFQILFPKLIDSVVNSSEGATY